MKFCDILSSPWNIFNPGIMKTLENHKPYFVCFLHFCCIHMQMESKSILTKMFNIGNHISVHSLHIVLDCTGMDIVNIYIKITNGMDETINSFSFFWYSLKRLYFSRILLANSSQKNSLANDKP